MKTVCVVMSTYNGEKFLMEQLESIRAQKLMGGVKLSCLYVRDDGSSDATVKILEKFRARKMPFDVVICKGENLGFSRSFSYTIKNAPDADYYALCDQDDVWLENKLNDAISALEKEDESRPNMFCTQTTVTDEKLNVKDTTNKVYNPNSRFLFEETLILNNFSGNTMVFNRALRQLYKKIPSEKIWAHDWTINLLACAFGKRIFSPNSQILYRQHGKNCIGVASINPRKIWQIIVKFFKNERGLRTREAQNFLDYFSDELDENKKEFVKNVAIQSHDRKARKYVKKYMKQFENKNARRYGNSIMLINSM